MTTPDVVAIGDQGDAARADTRRLLARIRDIAPDLWIFPGPHGPWASAQLASIELPGRRVVCRSIVARFPQPVVVPVPRTRVCGDCYLDALARVGAPEWCQQCRRRHTLATPVRTVAAQAGWTVAAGALCGVCITAEHWQAPA